jgi:molybdopterin biosynthesis enzyme
VRVAIAAFGTELCEPGASLQPGQIFDSNSAMAEAFFSGSSVQLVRGVRVRDARCLARDVSGNSLSTPI